MANNQKLVSRGYSIPLGGIHSSHQTRLDLSIDASKCMLTPERSRRIIGPSLEEHLMKLSGLRETHSLPDSIQQRLNIAPKSIGICPECGTSKQRGSIAPSASCQIS